MTRCHAGTRKTWNAVCDSRNNRGRGVGKRGPDQCRCPAKTPPRGNSKFKRYCRLGLAVSRCADRACRSIPGGLPGASVTKVAARFRPEMRALKRKRSGLSVFGCSRNIDIGTSHCSTLPSTASCADVIWWRCASTMLSKAVIASRAIVMQKKTQRPAQFERTEQTRDAVDAWDSEGSPEAGAVSVSEPRGGVASSFDAAVLASRPVMGGIDWA